MPKSRKEYDQKYEEKRAGQRTRNWTVIFYPEDLPEDWASMLDELHFKWVCSPLHDKDLNADGTPKKAHYHTLFMFEAVKTADQVEELLQNLYGVSDTGSIVGVAKPMQAGDRGALVRYFAHMDNPEKAQYEISDIVGHNGADPAELLRFSATETHEMIIAMEEYIEQNEIYEIADFSAAIRYDHPEWHTLLATKMTLYFNSFIKSRRHSATPKVIQVDKDGVVIPETE